LHLGFHAGGGKRHCWSSDGSISCTTLARVATSICSTAAMFGKHGTRKAGNREDCPDTLSINQYAAMFDVLQQRQQDASAAAARSNTWTGPGTQAASSEPQLAGSQPFSRQLAAVIAGVERDGGDGAAHGCGSPAEIDAAIQQRVSAGPHAMPAMHVYVARPCH
jgi:hypothetical protein